MLERNVIQVRGFRNITDEKGEVSGFQVRVRNTYYRAAWLSLYRFGDVVVDGKVYDKDSVLWEIGGMEYTRKQALKMSDTQWSNMEAATVKVKKAGGLSSGYHDVSVAYSYVASYEPMGDPDETGELTEYTARMILV